MTTPVDVPNVVGIHALVWVGDTAPASVHFAIEQTVASGYGLLEFSLHDSVNLDRTKTRELLRATGFRPHARADWRWMPIFPAPTQQVVERGAALLQESLQLTHDIGATILTGALYSAFGKARAPVDAGRSGQCRSAC